MHIVLHQSIVHGGIQEEGELEFAQDEEEQYDDELLQEEGEQIAADNLATRVVRRGNRGAQHAEIVADEEHQH